MVAWKCPVCFGIVQGFEGEHGVYHGICPSCGQGFGKYATDEDRQSEWEEHQHPLYAVCLQDRATETNRYYLVRGWLDHIIAAVENCEPGSIMTVFDTRTRRPVERMHARIGWNKCRTLGDQEWLVAHGGVA